jgi:hypothetical protein
MNIFEQEIQDGLADRIKASASISYAAIAEPIVSKDQSEIKCIIKSQAALNDIDLYYVQSILVTSSWNKNDDIFDKTEVWLAKNSPEDKPTNLEHDESTIIGHITSNWPIDEDGNKIPPDTTIDSLPEKFHIVTGSVIYRGFTDTALKERAEKLIAEIENGTKFVSMECFFKGFDYGVLNLDNNQYSILPRNNSTAHLTKFLRAYGGTGKHENYKIGRVLRDITFSGKGFVDKPANPDSIIFSKSCLCDKKNSSFSKEGVLPDKLNHIMETNDMSLETQDTSVALESTETQATETVNTPVVETETVATENTIVNETEAGTPVMSPEMEDKDKLMKMLEEKAMKMAEEKAMKMVEEKAAMMKAEYEDKYKTTMAELDATKTSLAEANETIAAYKNKEAEMMKKEKKNKRMATLVELGVTNELAASTVDKLDNVDDATFETLRLVFANTKTANVTETVAEIVPVTETATETVTPELLDNVEAVETVNLSVASEQGSSVEATRAELLEFVCARLGKKLNKGE